MKSGRKLRNTKSIRGEDLFFLEITMILGEKSERRHQSFFSCLENINFRKSLPRAPKFEYPPLVAVTKKLSCINNQLRCLYLFDSHVYLSFLF